ncbi:MAG TPA: 2-oxo acid dehydrogenase subunit E2 [Clostridiales bacterium]|nr:2-oxo acid dehydrogenase subunit E2 [Clostridiales bacterium]
MIKELKLPKMSDTMDTGQITKWLVKEGDFIKKGDPIFEMQTDKVNLEVEALEEGVLLKIVGKEGEDIPVGQVIAYLGDEGDKVSDIPAQPQEGQEKKQETEAKTEDVQMPKPSSAPDIQPEPTPDIPSMEKPKGDRIFISPRARALAQREKVDYSAIKGTGPMGEIIERDIKEYLAKSALQQPAPSKEQAVPSTAAQGQRIEMTGMRKVIAERMLASVAAAPHIYLTADIDMTQCRDMRTKINDSLADKGIKISYNDIIIKACALALKEYPYINSTLKDGAIILQDRINIGVAVSLADGLIVPVVRDTDKKTIVEISKEIKELAGKAREGKLMPDEFSGGTFTVSNLGMFDITQFTAIINQPESAILAVGAIKDTFVPVDGRPVVKPMMKVTLSCDHRVIDGAVGAQFLKFVKSMLENPLLML